MSTDDSYLEVRRGCSGIFFGMFISLLIVCLLAVIIGLIYFLLQSV